MTATAPSMLAQPKASPPRRVGLVTIGQAPRSDVVPAMLPLLGAGVEVVEAGCLDGLNADQIAELRPGPGDYVITTRLADGTSVVVSRGYVEARLMETIRRLIDRGASSVALLCTGDFGDKQVDVGVPLLRPDYVLAHTVRAVLEPNATLAVLTPLPQQREQAESKWRDIAGDRLVIEAASPYGAPKLLEAAAERLRELRPDLVVMDCIGYTPAMKAFVREMVDRPVILASSVVARFLAELA